MKLDMYTLRNKLNELVKQFGNKEETSFNTSIVKRKMIIFLLRIGS